MSILSHQFAIAAIDSKEEFPIDFDDVWRSIGYSRRDNALRRLEATHDNGVDYTLLFKEKRVDGHQGGGSIRYREVKLTIDAFKSFCMVAETPEGREVRKYFISIEKAYRQDLERNFTAVSAIGQETEFLDLLKLPLECEFPYTLDELHEDSGITSKSYVANVVRLGFKLDEDYQGYRYGDNKVTPKRISSGCYNILMVCFRSARGVDLTKMPSIIAIERDRYYAQRQPKKNRLYSHPDQLNLF